MKPYAKDAARVLLGVFCRAVMRTRSYLYQTFGVESLAGAHDVREVSFLM